MRPRFKNTYFVLLIISIFASSAFAISTQPAAFDYTGTYQLSQTDPNLTGHDVIIASICRSKTYVDGLPQNDYLPNVLHDCFVVANLNFKNEIEIDNSISSHATSILAIAAGYDSNAYHPEIGDFLYRGGSPDAHIDVYEFWDFLRDNLYFGDNFDADILTLSCGNFFEDWWTRGIQKLVEQNDIFVIAAIGNGYDVFDPLMYPAVGANVLGVGVIEPVKNSELTEFASVNPATSSSGPTSDLRCGPDIVAPGNCLVPSDHGQIGYEESGSWSSFAVPVVSSTAALLVQKAKTTPELVAANSPIVLRSILMNSARKLPYWHKGYAGPEDDHIFSLDFVQGAGAIDAVAAYDQLLAGRQGPGFVEAAGWDRGFIEGLTPRQDEVYSFETSGDENNFITATLVFNRHFAEKYPFEAEVHRADLSLEVWAVDPDDSSRDYMIDHCDSLTDNIEHIYCKADPNFVSYEIVVINKNQVPENYAIAWNVSIKDTVKSLGWYDITSDGKIDKDDFLIMVSRINEPIETEQFGYVTGDINMNGKIEFDDLAAILNYSSKFKGNLQ